MKFQFNDFITQAHQAAQSGTPVKSVRQVMESAFADLDALRAGLPVLPPDCDDVIHFEDASMTIYQSRFRATIDMPPHDHQMPAIIGLYHGAERNDFYHLGKRDAGEAFLTKSGGVSLTAGQVAAMGPHAIHTVTVTAGETSEAIHIYLGSLSAVRRNVFDIANEQMLPLTTENFASLSKVT